MPPSKRNTMIQIILFSDGKTAVGKQGDSFHAYVGYICDKYDVTIDQQRFFSREDFVALVEIHDEDGVTNFKKFF